MGSSHEPPSCEGTVERRHCCDIMHRMGSIRARLAWEESQARCEVEGVRHELVHMLRRQPSQTDIRHKRSAARKQRRASRARARWQWAFRRTKMLQTAFGCDLVLGQLKVMEVREAFITNESSRVPRCLPHLTHQASAKLVQKLRSAARVANETRESGYGGLGMSSKCHGSMRRNKKPQLPALGVHPGWMKALAAATAPPLPAMTNIRSIHLQKMQPMVRPPW